MLQRQWLNPLRLPIGVRRPRGRIRSHLATPTVPCPGPYASRPSSQVALAPWQAKAASDLPAASRWLRLCASRDDDTLVQKPDQTDGGIIRVADLAARACQPHRQEAARSGSDDGRRTKALPLTDGEDRLRSCRRLSALTIPKPCQLPRFVTGRGDAIIASRLYGTATGINGLPL